ncbi:YkgJ family cysteine cluster protein [Pseudomonas sp. SA3-5]|uniref:YkgJ family cysteine cluster protein n=1 Tax=Pseudomonas aestuarii TaxID=3018340 RepID=A0ABT4XBZ1_9PSED|nr:YkgJ family cysteine cluster protein [Pseudomonas aestuarii]MDA7085714.1 YkgJ family cysteine cluster protein [Pseudomonas aestuarii]
MQCRAGCGACCIAPSISSSIPGMPNGKAAGERCIQLSPENYCALFGKAERPAVCSAFLPDPDVCGSRNEEAIQLLGWLEQQTALAS